MATLVLNLLIDKALNKFAYVSLYLISLDLLLLPIVLRLVSLSSRRLRQKAFATALKLTREILFAC